MIWIKCTDENKFPSRHPVYARYSAKGEYLVARQYQLDIAQVINDNWINGNGEILTDVRAYAEIPEIPKEFHDAWNQAVETPTLQDLMKSTEAPKAPKQVILREDQSK